MATLIELDFTKMPDGSVVSIFQDGDGYLVAMFDRHDITQYEEAVADKDEAWAMYRKLAAGGTLGYP